MKAGEADRARVNAIFDSTRARHPGDGRDRPPGSAAGRPRRPAHGAWHEPLLSYCVPWNTSATRRWRALRLRRRRMPLSIQVIGRPATRPTLLSLAAQLEPSAPGRIAAADLLATARKCTSVS